MAAHFPLASEPLASGVGSSPGRLSAHQVANLASKQLPTRTALDPIGGREKFVGGGSLR